MEIIPVGDRIYIQLLEREEGKKIVDETTGREFTLHYGQGHSEKTRVAEVKAIGEDVKKFKVGDLVLVSFYTGAWLHLVKHDMTDERNRICTESEIIAKIKDY